uniref:Uncharacterized protein n=1 Tax=Salmo trutta TaxID=8032 RepID=A0A674B9G8_SALTR
MNPAAHVWFVTPLHVVLLSLYVITDCFLKQHLGAAGQESADTEALQQELRDMKQRCELLAEENKGLKNRLQRYEPTQEDGAAE